MNDFAERLTRLSAFRLTLLARRLEALAAAPGPEVAPPSAALVAYLVPRADRPVSPEEIRTYLAEKLPDYMIPGRFIFLDELPLTPNGKLDRAALPDDPPGPGLLAEAAFVAPRTDLEKEIAAVWADLLGFDMIGCTDDFFELGGHSLLVTRCLLRLRDRFQVEIPVSQFFAAPTVAALAEQVQTLRWLADPEARTRAAEESGRDTFEI